MSWWGALIGLARAVEQNSPTEGTDELMMGGLFATLTNVNFNDDTLRDWIRRVHEAKNALARTVPCARIPVATTGITIWKSCGRTMKISAP